LVRALQRRGSNSSGALASPGALADSLSQRQLNVLALAAGGLTDDQIAARLVLTASTVRVHMHHAIQKLGVADRTGAIAWYNRQRGAEPPAQ
jgi:DNA-binding NarL/FixJ family response regulator